MERIGGGGNSCRRRKEKITGWVKKTEKLKKADSVGERVHLGSTEEKKTVVGRAPDHIGQDERQKRAGRRARVGEYIRAVAAEKKRV